MMKIKTNSKKEAELVSDWLFNLGVSHTFKGFLIETPNVDDSLRDQLYSVVELNTGVSIKHLEWR